MKSKIIDMGYGIVNENVQIPYKMHSNDEIKTKFMSSMAEIVAKNSTQLAN